MGMFSGKKGLITGVFNEKSIAWAIAELIMREGAVRLLLHARQGGRSRPEEPWGAASKLTERAAERQVSCADGRYEG